MRNIATIIITLLLTGCFAATVQQRTARTITILDALGGTDTQAIADQHCQAQQRHAVFRGHVRQPAAKCYNGCQYFECVQ